MPHSPEEKKRVITRLSRIRGQAAALERAVEAGTECGALLQQLAALRGATNGLMAEVLESHLRETFAQTGCPARDPQAAEPIISSPDVHGEIDQIMRIIRTYLK
ncbi:MAG: metal-sensing transcriptional repressor [Xanthobacter sp.]